MKRRTFIETSILSTVVTVCPGCTSNCNAKSNSKSRELSPESYSLEGSELIVDLNKASFLNEVDASGKVKLKTGAKKDLKVLIVHTSTNEYRAFENRCAHGGMPVKYKPGDQILRCVSFGHSKYDMKGNVVKGPAVNPIKSFPLTRKEDKLRIAIT
jgi:Rieske Fe-S protein